MKDKASIFPFVVAAVAAAAFLSIGKKKEKKTGGYVWKQVNLSLFGLQYYWADQLKGSDPPPPAIVARFQSEWNLVLDKMVTGKLTELPGFSFIGKLEESGEVSPQMISAMGVIAEAQKAHKMGAGWATVVSAAKLV